MKLTIAALNPAIERLLVVQHNVLGQVHTLVRDETLAGGKGVNVARVFSQLSSPEFIPSGVIRQQKILPRLVGVLGGATGDLLRSLLAAEKIHGDWVDIHEATRTNEVIVDESDPVNATVYNAIGPRLAPDELQRLRVISVRALENSSALICTGSVPPGIPASIYADWIGAASIRGVPSLLDAHGDVLRLAAQAAPTVIKVNRDELEDLAGVVEPDRLVASWIAGGTTAVIVTNGTRPTVAATPDGWFSVHPPTTNALSAVGSGDAFAAGLMWSLLMRAGGWSDHLRLATACGASNAADIQARLHSGTSLAGLESMVEIRGIEQANA